jgi:protein-disulfide isomerase
MNSETKIITSIGIITVLVVIMGLYFSGGAASKESSVNIQPTILVNQNSARVVAKDAKVQIVEFADFECPACAVQAPLIRKFLDAHKDNVDYVFRIIPIHDSSKDAAAAAYAAGEQGKFFEMGDILFAKQDEWSSDPKAKLVEKFSTYAAQLNLDMNKFKADIVNNRAVYDARVDADAKDAVAMNIMSTPTLIINGKESLRGVQSFEKLESFLSGNKAVTATTTKPVEDTTKIPSIERL